MQTRRSTSPIVTVLLGVITAVLVLMAGASSANAAPGVVIGVEQNGGIHDPVRRELILDTQRSVGAKVIRILLRYDQVALCDPGTAGTNHAHSCYDWSVPDAVARGAEARGMKTLFSVYGVPKWKFNGAENFTGTLDQDFNGFVAGYANFVQAAATRYDGRHGLPRINQWTIWNEPNGSFFQPRMIEGKLVGPARYARMYDAAARRVKSVDPTLLVGVGPTAPMSPSLTPVVFAQHALPVLQQLNSPIDAWAHNAYTGRQSPFRNTIDSPYVGLGNLEDLTDIMDRYPVAANKPLWITEFGYQTQVGEKFLMTEADQALLAADAIRFANAHPRINTFIWYSLHDDEASAGPYSFQSGIFRAASRLCGKLLCPKQSAEVFKRTLWLSPVSGGKITVWGQARIAPAATRIFVQRPGQAWQAFANADTASTGTAQVRIDNVPGTLVMVCDTSCSPSRTLTATVAGGGGGTVQATKVQRQRLAHVALGKKSSLARGITYGVPCTGCKVSAVVIAYGRTSGIAAAARRQVIVARSKVTTRAAKHQVVLRFTPGARKQLTRRTRPRLTIRTTVRYTSGRIVISDRPITLR